MLLFRPFTQQYVVIKGVMVAKVIHVTYFFFRSKIYGIKAYLGKKSLICKKKSYEQEDESQIGRILKPFIYLDLKQFETKKLFF